MELFTVTVSTKSILKTIVFASVKSESDKETRRESKRHRNRIDDMDNRKYLLAYSPSPLTCHVRSNQISKVKPHPL